MIDGFLASDIGPALRIYRFSKGFNGRNAASWLGVDPSTAARLERGEIVMTRDYLEPYCRKLKKSLREIMEATADMPDMSPQSLAHAINTMAMRQERTLPEVARDCRPKLREYQLEHFVHDPEKHAMGPKRLFLVARSLGCDDIAHMVKKAAEPYHYIDDAALRDSLKLLQTHDKITHAEMAGMLGESLRNYQDQLAGRPFSRDVRRNLPLEEIVRTAQEIRAEGWVKSIKSQVRARREKPTIIE